MVPSSPRHVVITGLMGVGKSTTAVALATELGRRHRDSDTDLECLFGRTGAELAADLGVAELHRLEAATLLGALAEAEPLVISAAASVVEDARCREALARRAIVVVLDAPVPVVLERMASGSHRRPMDPAELETVAARRSPWFDHVAAARVDATGDRADVVRAAASVVVTSSR